MQSYHKFSRFAVFAMPLLIEPDDYFILAPSLSDEGSHIMAKINTRSPIVESVLKLNLNTFCVRLQS